MQAADAEETGPPTQPRIRIEIAGDVERFTSASYSPEQVSEQALRRVSRVPGRRIGRAWSLRACHCRLPVSGMAHPRCTAQVDLAVKRATGVAGERTAPLV